jgi:hypothetical protein
MSIVYSDVGDYSSMTLEELITAARTLDLWQPGAWRHPIIQRIWFLVDVMGISLETEQEANQPLDLTFRVSEEVM